MKKSIYTLIFCNLMGWSVEGGIDENLKKCVLIVMPHTSWHDFFIGLFARGVIGVEINWVGKKELFRFPLKYYFKYMGGAPLDRSGGLNKVDSIVEIFRKKDIFRLAIAPEGTRKKVDNLKTGFYYIAMKAGVPIIPVAFDFGKKKVSLGNPFHPTGNFESDLEILKFHYKGVKGQIQENGFDFGSSEQL